MLLLSEPGRAEPSALPQRRSGAGTGQRLARPAGGSLRRAGRTWKALVSSLSTAPKCQRNRESALLVLLWCYCDRLARTSSSGLQKDVKTPASRCALPAQFPPATTSLLWFV